MEVIWRIRWWSGAQESASCLKSCQSDGLLHTRVNTKISHQLTKWSRKNEKTPYLNTLYPCVSCKWPQIEHIINDIVGKYQFPFSRFFSHFRNKWKSNNFRSYWGTIWVHCTWGTKDKLQIEQDISFKQILADKDWLPRALSTQDGFCHFYCRHHKTIKSQH